MNRPRVTLSTRALLLATALVLPAALALLLMMGSSGMPQANGAENASSAPRPVWVTRVAGAIDPALAGFLEKIIKAAAREGAGLIVVEMDTPGGLDTSMRQIIQAEIGSTVPVVIFVSPQGARSASAGVYIMMGADVAAMAPQTNLGSAHPVSLTGDMDEEMKKKVTNDAAAYIKGLATEHGRNAVWAEQAVRESVNLTAEEAKAQGVIEFVAADLADLLAGMDGYVTKPKGLTLRTVGAPLERVEMSWSERLFHVLVDPNIVFILLTVGVLGIVLELSAPGIGVAGILGGISLLLSLYGLQMLPVSWVGLGLVALGLVLLVAEVAVPGVGALGVGGVVSLALGGLLLFNADQSALRVNWLVVALAAVIVAVLFLFVIRAVARSRRGPSVMGAAGMVGQLGTVRSTLDPQGQIMVVGELWKAVSTEGAMQPGEEVEVTSVEGLTLGVRRTYRSGVGGQGDLGPGGAKEE